MTDYSRFLILFPCYQLDDFPKNLPSKQAAGVLAGWTVLWHPHFIVKSDRLPEWVRADQPPSDWANTVAILPAASESRFPDLLRSQIDQQGGKAISCSPTRREILAQLEQSGVLSPDVVPSETSHLIEEFFALGFCCLQVQLMTKQLRYASNLDQALLTEQVVQAAKATLAGDVENATSLIQSCFDQLGQERDHYYSHDTSILEIILLAKSTLGPKLNVELNRKTPLNILASADLLEELSHTNPEALELIKARVQEGTLSIIGGLDRELPHPLLESNAIARSLDRGAAIYAKLVGAEPKVFSRFRHGMTSNLPQILKPRGILGALLVSWEQGTYPEASQVKAVWEASDGTGLETISGPVLDGSSSETYLSLGNRLGQSLDHDHISTLVVAHWPGQRADSLEDHAVVAKHTPALGRWITAEKYFETTAHPYHQERLAPNEFRPVYFQELVAKDAVNVVSGLADYHELTERTKLLQSLELLASQLSSVGKKARNSGAESNDSEHDSADRKSGKEYTARFPSGSAAVWETLDGAVDRDGLFTERSLTEARSQLDTIENQTLAGFAKLVVPRGANSDGLILVNPTSTPRRLGIEPGLGLDADSEAKWLYAQINENKTIRSVVDLPSFGVLQAAKVSGPTLSRGQLPRSTNLAAADGFIGNEFIEAQVDKATGQLRSMHAANRRGNRYSMQLAIFDPRGAGTSERPYSTAKVDSIRLVASSPVFGQIESMGRLYCGSREVAKFQIDYRLWRGSRILELNLKVDLAVEFLEDPWNSYLAIRSAWPSEIATLYGTVAGSRQSLPRGKFVSPRFVEIDEVDHSTTLLTCGVAHHRRTEERFLDSLLVVRGEHRRSFRFGIGLDLPQPQQSADAFLLTNPLLLAIPSISPSQGTSWFFHVDPATVAMRLVADLVNGDGQTVGVRLELRETRGKLLSARVRCLRDAASAQRVNSAGKKLGTVEVEGDKITLTLNANETALVDVLWK